jgi:hypothetical protein
VLDDESDASDQKAEDLESPDETPQPPAPARGRKPKPSTAAASQLPKKQPIAAKQSAKKAARTSIPVTEATRRLAQEVCISSTLLAHSLLTF